ncbi:hypothetical protein AVEN_99328-1 [Araneus ventricosus]|uniref:Uncharacterized protein n=1 Tax=Araneus ventricosus TaxID=182803 RepID=A0A4Y2V0M0_ARAVE|nr:hypothetical protein AVEN_99328-1 [Araneus ventricosus]
MEIGIAESQCCNSNELKIQHFLRLFQFGARLEGSGTSKDLPTLKHCFEGRNETRNFLRGGRERGWVEFCDFESCFRTNFGVSVNDVPHFSTSMDGKKPVSGQMEWSTDGCPA